MVKDGEKWKVKKGGRTVSTHYKKRAAMRKARSKANKGDSVQAQKSSGKWDNERTKKTYGKKGDK